MRIRVDPAIHVHYDLVTAEDPQRRMVLESLRGNARFELLSCAALQALHLASDWILMEDYVRQLSARGPSAEDASAFMRDAIAKGLLQTDPGPPEEEGRGRLLNDVGASLSHQLLLAKNNLTYLDYGRPETLETEALLMESYISEQELPDIYKDCKEPLGTVALSPGGGESGPPIRYEPATPRGEPVDLEWLARFLHLTFGVIGTIGDQVQKELVLKTYPSGGARHPLECYVVALSVAGLDFGVYHYSTRRHALDLLPSDARALSACLFPDSAPPLILVLTALPERVMWRYREPTSVCVTMLDLGHAIGNMGLACDSEGLKYRVQLAGDFERAGAVLGLPPFRELVLAGMALGERNPGDCEGHCNGYR
jgi:SagB-type dehydrogenase family enzyme